MDKFVCTVCGYVYDPAENDNVAFENLPDDYKAHKKCTGPTDLPPSFPSALLHSLLHSWPNVPPSEEPDPVSPRTVPEYKDPPPEARRSYQPVRPTSRS